MRVLLTWELGLNLGHLTRLLPVAERLKSEGHSVLIAVRDIQAAAAILGPAGIAFIQSPHLPRGVPLGHRATGYADILLSQGWKDHATLWGLVQSWLNIFLLFRPDKLILDYSPTVSLAASIAKLPTLLVGNGFELPPPTDPLPPFPGFSWAIPSKAVESEKSAVAAANRVLNAFKRAPITALRDVWTDQTRLFATFAELDHYGERDDAEYIGPLLGRPSAPRVEWPEGPGPKIFACLRPDTSQVTEILRALGMIKASVICVASGFTQSQLAPFQKVHIRYASGLVELQPLLNANLCISYGAEGTMLRFLLAGVPQFVSPWHVESYFAIRRIQTANLGRSAANLGTAPALVAAMENLMGNDQILSSARQFARRVDSMTSKQPASAERDPSAVSRLTALVNGFTDGYAMPVVGPEFRDMDAPAGSERSRRDYLVES